MVLMPVKTSCCMMTSNASVMHKLYAAFIAESVGTAVVGTSLLPLRLLSGTCVAEPIRRFVFTRVAGRSAGQAAARGPGAGQAAAEDARQASSGVGQAAAGPSVTVGQTTTCAGQTAAKNVWQASSGAGQAAAGPSVGQAATGAGQAAAFCSCASSGRSCAGGSRSRTTGSGWVAGQAATGVGHAATGAGQAAAELEPPASAGVGPAATGSQLVPVDALFCCLAGFALPWQGCLGLGAIASATVPMQNAKRLAWLRASVCVHLCVDVVVAGVWVVWCNTPVCRVLFIDIFRRGCRI